MRLTRPHTTKDSRVRYIALYRDQRKKVRSAGTYSSERQADKARQKAEAKIALDRLPDTTKAPSKGQFVDPMRSRPKPHDQTR